MGHGSATNIRLGHYYPVARILHFCSQPYGTLHSPIPGILMNLHLHHLPEKCTQRCT